MEKSYESMMVLRDDVSQEELNDVCQKMSKKIESLGGKVVQALIYAKDKQFCFPMRGRGAGRKKYFRGTFWQVNFDIEAAKLPELKEVMRLEERILRNLTLARDLRKEVAEVKA